MNEQEFDRKIKDSALRQESGIEKPLWNKNGVWNRIDSGLERKNRSGWWKAAAVILILISTGWSFAQWSNFRQYKLEKELELNELHRQLEVIVSVQVEKLHENEMIIQQKNQELDVLKKQMLSIEGNSRKREVQKQIPIRQDVAENQETKAEQDHLIDSLKKELILMHETAGNNNVSAILKEKRPMQREIIKVPETVHSEIQTQYISNHQEPQISKKERFIKIRILRFQESRDIEYQSDYSIFKK